MKCPRCSQEISDRKCSLCGSEILVESLFCHRCGRKLENNVAVPAAREQGEESVDFSRRTLCSDGTCIGVINADGFCKVCGKPYTGEP
jgi:predicted amidophosphoribosyltransferase